MESKRKPLLVTVECMYAPTFSAAAKMKEFFSDLQDALDGADEHDVILTVSDYNAVVGSGGLYCDVSVVFCAECWMEITSCSQPGFGYLA